jgi:hypothetical protein
VYVGPEVWEIWFFRARNYVSMWWIGAECICSFGGLRQKLEVFVFCGVVLTGCRPRFGTGLAALRRVLDRGDFGEAAECGGKSVFGVRDG